MNEPDPNQLIPRIPEPSIEAPDCWDEIGVGGDRSCAELQQYVHCRNCPGYAEAGMKLLDRELPPGYREEWTRRFAEVKAVVAAKTESVIIFRAGNESLALPTRVFQEVAERRVIRSLPFPRSGSLLGLANVRGELLVCLSLEHLLGVQAGGVSLAVRRAAYDRLMIARRHGFRLGFPVDKVFGVHRFHPQEVLKAPGLSARAGAAFTCGTLNWEGQAVGLLDEQRLFEALN
jgi:chemotaxis-related protein WspD